MIANDFAKKKDLATKLVQRIKGEVHCLARMHISKNHEKLAQIGLIIFGDKDWNSIELAKLVAKESANEQSGIS